MVGGWLLSGYIESHPPGQVCTFSRLHQLGQVAILLQAVLSSGLNQAEHDRTAISIKRKSLFSVKLKRLLIAQPTKLWYYFIKY